MSLSSFDGSPVPADFATKYDKIAAEYAKVRAHVGILKKAVIDEQTRCTELKEELKSKDQILRKHEQEFDSLSFRNQQLTKRVTVLQGELDHLQGSGKKSRHNKNDSNASIQDNLVIQEELEKKLIENMKLVTLLDDSRTEYEREKLLWQEEVTACKNLVRKSELQKTECECVSLRHALAAAESSLQRYKEITTSEPVKPRTYSQHVMTAVNDLPLSNLLNGIFELALACSKLAPVPPRLEMPQIDLSLPNSSHQALSCLVSYHSNLRKVIPLLNDSNMSGMFHAIDPILTDLQRNLEHLNKSLDASQGEEIFSALREVARSLRSASQYHLGVLKEVWECHTRQSPYDIILKSLSNIHTESILIWKFTSDSMKLFNSTASYETPNSIKENNAKPGSCKECLKISHNYEERILSLEEKIKHMTVTAESLPLLTKPDNVVSTDLSNELGHGFRPGEIGWPEAAVRDFILKRSSLTIEERQFAESKLTRYIAERDAALNRMVACEEQCKDQTDLIINLQEELATTKRNYEDQLSSLSEHMANMNDKLAAQETHIEELSYELMTKGMKKGRQK